MTSDWLPRYSLGTIVRDGPRFVFNLGYRWLVRQYYARYFSRNPDHRALDVAAATEALRTADSITFLCLGNICRSPMAEQYLEHRLTAVDGDRIEDGGRPVDSDRRLVSVPSRVAQTVPTAPRVFSAGLGRKEGRESPAAAVEVGRYFDVDLSGHRSMLASQELLDDSDVVFVMDYNNYHTVTRRYPDAVDRTFFLRPFADGEAVIGDPYGSSSGRFEAVYGTIADAVDAVAKVIVNSRAETRDE